MVDRPLVLSHRGRVRWPGPGCPPDNSLEALEQAFAAGADGAEIDVRLSACGALVLVHDRTVQDGRLVSELGREELDAAYGYRIPDLAEVLRRWPERIWDVELKSADTTLLAVRALRAVPIARLLVTSFLHPVARAVGESADVPFGYLIDQKGTDVSAQARAARQDGASAWVWHAEMLDEGVVTAGAAVDLETWVYGVPTPDAYPAAVRMHVAGIIADELEAALSATK